MPVSYPHVSEYSTVRGKAQELVISEIMHKHAVSGIYLNG